MASVDLTSVGASRSSNRTSRGPWRTAPRIAISPCGAIRSDLILLVRDFLHPFNDLAVESFLDRDVRHRRRGRRPMPMLFAGRAHDHITRPDFFYGAAPALDPSAAGRHDQRLTEGMDVPGGTRTWLARDTGARHAP